MFTYTNSASFVLEAIDCTLRYLCATKTPIPNRLLVSVAQQLIDAKVDLLDLGYANSRTPEEEKLLELSFSIKEKRPSARLAMLARPGGSSVQTTLRSAVDEVFFIISPIHSRHPINSSEFQWNLRSSIERVLEHNKAVSFLCRDVNSNNRREVSFALQGVLNQYPIKRVILTCKERNALSIKSLFESFYRQLPDDIHLCIQAHDNIGFACDIAFSAIEGGANSAICAVNGIGVCAKNADLKTFAETLPQRCSRTTRVQTAQLATVSQQVKALLKVTSQRAKRAVSIAS